MNNTIFSNQDAFKVPILYVDLNEQVDENLYLLAQDDVKQDINHNVIDLSEGQKIVIYMHDVNEENYPDDLYAHGIVETNKTEVANHVKWLVRIDQLKHISELKKED